MDHYNQTHVLLTFKVININTYINTLILTLIIANILTFTVQKANTIILNK